MHVIYVIYVISYYAGEEKKNMADFQNSGYEIKKEKTAGTEASQLVPDASTSSAL